MMTVLDSDNSDNEEQTLTSKTGISSCGAKHFTDDHTQE